MVYIGDMVYIGEKEMLKKPYEIHVYLVKSIHSHIRNI